MKCSSGQLSDSFLGLVGVSELDERETARLTGHSIPHQRCLRYLVAGSAEKSSDFVLFGASVEVSHEQTLAEGLAALATSVLGTWIHRAFDGALDLFVSRFFFGLRDDLFEIGIAWLSVALNARASSTFGTFLRGTRLARLFSLALCKRLVLVSTHNLEAVVTATSSSTTAAPLRFVYLDGAAIQLGAVHLSHRVGRVT